MAPSVIEVGVHIHCMYVCIYVCMYVCMYVRVCVIACLVLSCLVYYISIRKVWAQGLASSFRVDAHTEQIPTPMQRPPEENMEICLACDRRAPEEDTTIHYVTKMGATISFFLCHTCLPPLPDWPTYEDIDLNHRVISTAMTRLGQHLVNPVVNLQGWTSEWVGRTMNVWPITLSEIVYETLWAFFHFWCIGYRRWFLKYYRSKSLKYHANYWFLWFLFPSAGKSWSDAQANVLRALVRHSGLSRLLHRFLNKEQHCVDVVWLLWFCIKTSWTPFICVGVQQTCWQI
jgi:hypothetical protein